jgi:hypothetical protein
MAYDRSNPPPLIKANDFVSIYRNRNGNGFAPLPERMGYFTTDTYAALKEAEARFRELGGDFRLSDGYRSFDMQLQAHLDYLAGGGGNPARAQQLNEQYFGGRYEIRPKRANSPFPGAGMHQAGRAVDYDWALLQRQGISYEQQMEILEEIGFRFIPNDPYEKHHIDFFGPYEEIRRTRGYSAAARQAMDDVLPDNLADVPPADPEMMQFYDSPVYKMVRWASNYIHGNDIVPGMTQGQRDIAENDSPSPASKLQQLAKFFEGTSDSDNSSSAPTKPPASPDFANISESFQETIPARNSKEVLTGSEQDLINTRKALSGERAGTNATESGFPDGCTMAEVSKVVEIMQGHAKTRGRNRKIKNAILFGPLAPLIT